MTAFAGDGSDCFPNGATRPGESVDGLLVEAVRRIRAGKDAETGYRILDERLRPRLLRYFSAHGFTSADADDLVQNTLLRVFQGVEKLENESSFFAWLFTIARNVRLTALASRPPREESLEESPQLAETRTAGPGPGLDQTLLEPVWAAIQELPPQQRHSLLLRVREEMSYEEIAAALRISVNTVRNHLAQARASLRRVLKTELGGDL